MFKIKKKRKKYKIIKKHIQQTYVKQLPKDSQFFSDLYTKPVIPFYLTYFRFDTKNTRFLLQLSIKSKHLNKKKKTSIVQL